MVAAATHHLVCLSSFSLHRIAQFRIKGNKKLLLRTIKSIVLIFDKILAVWGLFLIETLNKVTISNSDLVILSEETICYTDNLKEV